MKNWNRARLFQFGTNLLRSGRSFNRAIEVLEKAAARQANNALLWYMAADLRFRQAEVEKDPSAKEGYETKAVLAMERGNAAAVLAPIKLPLPVPAWLRAAWKYREPKGFGDDGRLLFNLFTRVGDYLEAQDAAKHTDAVLRGASALMGMGMKAARSVADDPALDRSLSDLWQENNGRATRVMGGYCDGMKAYGLVLNSQKAASDERKSQFLSQNESNVNYLKAVDRGLCPR